MDDHRVEKCRNRRHDHGRCPSSGPTKLPTRILDLSDSRIRLHVSDDDYGEYACLSHCWGKPGASNVLRTTSENIKEFQSEIPLEKLPKSFRESSEFARGLGIRWLWIDSLCIQQDSAEDWEKEAAHMAKVYQNSLVTIAISQSASPDGGCFTRDEERLPITAPVAQLEDRLGSKELVYSQMRRDPGDRVVPPLSQRAWVLQEELLSPRTIDFNGPELIVSCKSTSMKCECGHLTRTAGLKPQIRFIDWSSNDAWGSHYASPSKMWQNIIVNYTGRNLTYESDIFPALSGIAKTWMSGGAGRYLAGHWERFVIETLVWKLRHDLRTISTHIDTSPWRAPAWSWASKLGQISFFSRYREDVVLFSATFVSAEIALVGSDPTGALSSGTLTVSTVHTPAKLTMTAKGLGQVIFGGLVLLEDDDLNYRKVSSHGAPELRPDGTAVEFAPSEQLLLIPTQVTLALAVATTRPVNREWGTDYIPDSDSEVLEANKNPANMQSRWFFLVIQEIGQVWKRVGVLAIDKYWYKRNFDDNPRAPKSDMGPVARYEEIEEFCKNLIASDPKQFTLI